MASSSLGVAPDPALDAWLAAGFGPDAAGEDRLDCVVGVLGVLQVLAGRRTDAAPADPWVRRWEGWVLGQTALPMRYPGTTDPGPGPGTGDEVSNSTAARDSACTPSAMHASSGW